MDGKQKTVWLGLKKMMANVANGDYGIDDDAFGGEEDEDGLHFLADMCDEVTDNIH